MKFIDLDKTAGYGKLESLAKKPFDLKNELNAERIKKCSVPMAEGLTYNWAAKAAGDEVIAALKELAAEQEILPKYRALLDGEVMNTGEKRRVLHQLLRGRLGKDVIDNGKNLGDFYEAQKKRVYDFAKKVRAEGKFTAVCQIGIGGSDLGPRAMAIALKNWAETEKIPMLKTAFISNVDPDDPSEVVANLPLDKTLFILVSKSGTTQETLSNELFVKGKLKAAGLDPAKHMVAVTSETSPLAGNPGYLDSFYFDDFIGGRYSATSPVGGVILSLAYGPETFEAFLAGAHAADKSALEEDVLKNPALLDALLGVWERNFCGLPCTAVLPYSQALSRFPAHLQQLDMESNGKSVNRDGKPVSYATGPVVFGEPGTNGQHSFYQLLHQGRTIVPLQFIGFTGSQRGDDVEVDGSSSQTKLLANLAAQITAFAKGKSDTNGNKNFEGGRPSSLIYGKRLTPGVLGALLAHYENKVMFQGFLWNLNSFDQEGVQLGKVLAKKILSKTGATSGDPALDAYGSLLGV